MGLANIKVASQDINALRRYTGEKTGQKAVQTAILYFIKEARQRRIVQVLQESSFQKGYDPLMLRRRER